jgi:hypothetical protein
VSAVQCWPDPGLVRGPLRVLPRTDGMWIVYDERRPIGTRQRAVSASLDGAIDALNELADAEGHAIDDGPRRLGAAELHAWFATRPHTPECRCPVCRSARPPEAVADHTRDGHIGGGWETCPGCGFETMQYGHCDLPDLGCGAKKFESMPHVVPAGTQCWPFADFSWAQVEGKP